MTQSFTPLHPLFAAEVSAVDLRSVFDAATLDAIRGGMDQYGVLVFRGQPFQDAEQIDFAQPFDDRKYRRELRRTTTLDLPLPQVPAAV